MASTRAPHRRLLLLGGHPVYRDALRVGLSRHGFALVPTGSLEDAVEAARSGPLDGALLDDGGLGDAGALAAVTSLLAADPTLRVALLTDTRSSEVPGEAIRAGVSALLSKDLPLADLGRALERMAEGQIVVDPAVTRDVLASLVPRREDGNGRANGRGDPVHLSGVERRVLRLTAEGKVNKQIASELGLSPLTVKNHLARIRIRLGAADKAHAVAIALRSGLLE